MFEDLDQFFDDTLKLPIGGKVYAVPSPDIQTGLYCQRIAETGLALRRGQQLSDSDRVALQLDDDQEREWYHRLMGTAYEQMVADGVTWAKVQRAGATTFAWITAGEQAAQRTWRSDRPEADGASSTTSTSAPTNP